jgi:acetolactate synthase I/III small subunit
MTEKRILIMIEEKHVLSILVENQPGVLSRISGLFGGRGYNIDSLCVAETTEPHVSRVTIVATANRVVLEQIMKQLHKLINVMKVIELTGTEFVQREMALIKVNAKPEHRAEILRIVDIFRAKIIDVGLEHYTIEITGDEDKLSAILSLLKPLGIKEIAKTGIIALSREPKTV